MYGNDPYNFFMSSTADPSNYYNQGGYSSWQNQVVGGPDPQASYYDNSDQLAMPSGESTAFRQSPSQVPGTSGAPSETPSATPGGVSSGRGTGVPNAYPGSLAGILQGLGGQGQSQPNNLKQMMTLGQIGMRMMNPNNPQQQQQQQQQQNPQAVQIARMFGVDYQTAMALMQMMQRNQQPQTLPQMQYGGRPTGPTLVGEQGPEIFTPDVPGTISPNPRTLMQTLPYVQRPGQPNPRTLMHTLPYVRRPGEPLPEMQLLSYR